VGCRSDNCCFLILIFKERKASKELEGVDPKHVNPGQTTGFESIIKVGEKINPDDDPKEKVKHP
jgi:hypothetical protein